VSDVPAEYGLYRELAGWWPLISPPVEYAADAAVIATIFGSAEIPVRTVLDLGSGGGHVALHLKGGRSMTLVDLSAEMLAVSRRLNPDCAHVQGDMRTVRLGRLFDAVLVHDAVDYVTSQHDLRRVIETAFIHCRPAGLAVFAPDYTAETFRAAAGGGGGRDGAGRQASFRERTSDPDPGDDWILAEYEFSLREADGTVRIVPEAHRLGSFGRETWLRLLAGAGFEASARPGVQADGGRPCRALFVGRRPHTHPEPRGRLSRSAGDGSAGAASGSLTRKRVSPGSDSTRKSP
jgi:SAM-dependent methyltransferase